MPERIVGSITADNGGSVHVVLDSEHYSGCDAVPWIEPDALMITRFFTTQKWRSQGKGAIVMEELKRLAREAGYTRLLVAPGGYDPHDQPKRVAFYERHGFKLRRGGVYQCALIEDPTPDPATFPGWAVKVGDRVRFRIFHSGVSVEEVGEITHFNYAVFLEDGRGLGTQPGFIAKMDNPTSVGRQFQAAYEVDIVEVLLD